MKIEKVNRAFKKQVFQTLAFIIGAIVLNRLSAGGGLLLLILASIYCATSHRIGMFMVMYMLIPFLTELNAQLVGSGLLFRYGARVAVFTSTALILLQYGSKRGRYSLPIGGMFLYLLFAIISSVDGYCPIVSYLKILNFSVFMIGLYFGGRLLAENLKELNIIRAGVMAAAILLVFGSIFMFLVPSIGYMSTEALASQGYTESQIAQTLASSGDLNLFRGVANHSQTLAVMLVVFIGWVICDMFFVEQRLTGLHISIIIAGLPLFQKTGSRTALLGLFSLCFILAFFSVPKAHMSAVAKQRIKALISSGAIILVIWFCCMQIVGGGLSRWIRKTSDDDSRGLMEAVTATRMGLVESCMAEFRSKPMFGVGFQVNEESAEYARRQGFVISAPIERGVLPVAILAETGVMGAISFTIFLIMFYAGCLRQKFTSTLTLFTVYLVLNLSECTFFSPNGGGTQWVILLIGGFVIDVYNKTQQRYKAQQQQLYNATVWQSPRPWNHR